VPSARSRIVNGVTRAMIRIAYRSPEDDVTAYRPRYAKTDARVRKLLPPGLTTEELDAPPGRWVRNANASDLTILYLHGGAFILRIPRTHTAFAASLCRDLDASAFLPWYRLAPEHPFPAAPEDCLSAYRHLLDSGHAPEKIVVMGDSAGANLTLSLLHLIRRADLPMPLGAVTFSAITDFAEISGTWRLNTWRDPMYIVQGAVQPQRHYLQGASPVDPIASPYYGELAGLPPLRLVVGGVEALLEDSVKFVQKAVEAGTRASVQIWKGMPHVFLLYDFLPETALARADVVSWVRSLLDGPVPDSTDAELPYRDCVELVDRHAVTGSVRRVTNSIDLVD